MINSNSSQQNNFFVLTRKDSVLLYRTSPVDFEEGFAKFRWDEQSILFLPIKCIRDPMHGSVRIMLSSELRGELTDGKIADVVWTDYGHMLVNDRVLAIFERARVTGFRAQKVEIDRNGFLYLVVPTGWAGVVDGKSNIRRSDYCEVCGHVTYTADRRPSTLVDRQKWDGSDIFMTWPLPALIFGGEKLATILQEEAITGIACVPEFNVVRKGDRLSPGKLRFYMTDALAKTRGLAEGILEI